MTQDGRYAAVSTGRRVATGALVTVTAVVVATVVAVLAMLLLRLTVDDTSGWADLAALVGGMVIGAGAGAVGWLVALVVAVRRLAPPGRRAALSVWPTALALGAVGLLLAVRLLAPTGLEAAGPPLLGVGVVLLLAAAPLGLGLARTPWAAEPAGPGAPGGPGASGAPDQPGPSTQPSGSASA